MGGMSDLDVLLTEASETGESAGRRLKAVIEHIEQLGPVFQDEGMLDELKAAAADAYDCAVDFPMEVRKMITEPHPPYTLDDVYDSVQKVLAEVTIPPMRLVLGVPTEAETVVGEPPVTDYDLRIEFADGTAEDVPNIHGVQIQHRPSATFPFGFQEVGLEYDAEGNPVNHKHVAGYFAAEDGEFHPFSPIEKPAPFDGW